MLFVAEAMTVLNVLFAGRIRSEKNFVEVLRTAQGHNLRVVLRAEGKSFLDTH